MANPFTLASNLLAKCRRQGLVNPVTGEGAPTEQMSAEEFAHANGQLEGQIEELAIYVARLARAVRKHEPANPVAKKAMQYVVRIGQAKALR